MDGTASSNALLEAHRRSSHGWWWRSRVRADRLFLGAGCRLMATLTDRAVVRYARRAAQACDAGKEGS